MDYFGGKLSLRGPTIWGAERWDWNAEDQFQTLRAKVNALQTERSAVMGDNVPLCVNCQAEERRVRSKNGKVWSRTRETEHGFAVLCCLGLSFHASTEGDSVLLLKALELTLLRREMLNWGHLCGSARKQSSRDGHLKA